MTAIVAALHELRGPKYGIQPNHAPGCTDSFNGATGAAMDDSYLQTDDFPFGADITLSVFDAPQRQVAGPAAAAAQLIGDLPFGTQ